MPGKGHAYQITKEWQDLVRRKVNEVGHNEFARLAKIAPSSLTALLRPDAIQTAKMPAINKVLGLPPPLDKPSPAVQEAARYLAELDDLEQGRWVERLRQAAEEKRKRR